jgi:hypothetical protein
MFPFGNNLASGNRLDKARCHGRAGHPVGVTLFHSHCHCAEFVSGSDMSLQVQRLTRQLEWYSRYERALERKFP